ncbi:MAG: preprotein translocase subunit YajC [Bacteroidia bacterium]|jgi:preprotein translocase subunit YajC|nr:preprotein translocase subunit YajC [Bacteroidia bacterium]
MLLFGQPQGAPGGEAGKSNYSSLLFLLVLIVVFYLFFIRPQVKKTKDQKNFQESLAKGDNVITVGGIHGKILEVHETSVTIDTGGGAKLRVEKSALSMGTTAGQKDKK